MKERVTVSLAIPDFLFFFLFLMACLFMLGSIHQKIPSTTCSCVTPTLPDTAIAAAGKPGEVFMGDGEGNWTWQQVDTGEAVTTSDYLK